jgi:hypothetical protein
MRHSKNDKDTKDAPNELCPMRHAGDGVAKATRNVKHAKWRQESRRHGNPGKSFFGAIWHDLARFDCGDPGWVGGRK